jgi:hypothetical protein
MPTQNWGHVKQQYCIQKALPRAQGQPQLLNFTMIEVVSFCTHR